MHRPSTSSQTRLTLTTPSEPQDETTAPPEHEPAADPTTDRTPGAESSAGGAREQEPEPEPGPGVGEAVGGVRAAFMRMLEAHLKLLRAELAITGRELGIIVGLAAGALAIAILAAILLYVGSFLFFGELLFGSMGWGIIHGTLLAAVFIAFVAIDLAGGQTVRYGWGAAIGVGVAIVLAVALLSNVGNTGGESLRDWLDEAFVTEDLPFASAWLVTLGGFVVIGLIGLIVTAVAGWRAEQRGSGLLAIALLGFVLGGFIGALWFSTRYEAPDGVIGLSITVGLLTWIIAGVVLAARAGFDPEARYADLIPRESMAAFERTKGFMSEQWERQKNRMLGR